VAAQGPYSLRTAALHADALVTLGDIGDQPAATLPKLRQRFDRFGEICQEVGRDPKAMRRAYLAGWADDRPFESDQALREFVQAFADVGVTDFMFVLSDARASLEQTAASLESLRAVASV
jgi:alkanesulfonate monooxygenase SsuD/methylene tetrahydromethanopterin reductase-like flavin-dependent oxidoreductase (luciferase family)